MGEVARIMMGWQNRPLIIRQSQLMQPTSKRTALPQAWCKKKGAWASDRADQGRHEHKASCSYRYSWTSSPLLYHSRSGERLYWRCCPNEWPARADWLLADRRYDADWFREGLIEKGTRPCILECKSRKTTIRYDKRRYKRRNRIEHMFGRVKDWRRAATRNDRSPTVFLSAIMLAATVIFWL
jgi:transposase